jgi:hypothetical protein
VRSRLVTSKAKVPIHVAFQHFEIMHGVPDAMPAYDVLVKATRSRCRFAAACAPQRALRALLRRKERRASPSASSTTTTNNKTSTSTQHPETQVDGTYSAELHAQTGLPGLGQAAAPHVSWAG